MKHLLNNLSDEEKNSIREQHNGGMLVDTSRFKLLVESTLGDSKPLINKTKEVNEFFNPFKRKKNDDEHYIKVKKWMGKTNVKLISRLEPKYNNGVVYFTIDKMEDNGKIERIGEIRLIYSGREKAKELENGHMLQLSDFEQDRLINKYFGGTISRGNK